MLSCSEVCIVIGDVQALGPPGDSEFVLMNLYPPAGAISRAQLSGRSLEKAAHGDKRQDVKVVGVEDIAKDDNVEGITMPLALSI